MADRHPDGPSGRLRQRIAVDGATVGGIEHQQRLTVLAVLDDAVGDIGTGLAGRGQRHDVVAGPCHIGVVAAIPDCDELGVGAAAGDHQALRRHRRRGLRRNFSGVDHFGLPSAAPNAHSLSSRPLT